jgi:hypothetical protein
MRECELLTSAGDLYPAEIKCRQIERCLEKVQGTCRQVLVSDIGGQRETLASSARHEPEERRLMIRISV